MLASDPVATFRRVEALAAYMSANVLSPAGHSGGTFVCPSAVECRQSVTGADYHEAQLSHVGEHYDLLEGDHQLRVMVVGQEYGGAQHLVGLAARRQMILTDSGRGRAYYATGSWKARNPHMRGTTSALRLLLGREAGTDRDGEFLDLASGERVHLFDAFALVNVLLCAAHKAGSAQGRSSGTMRENCLKHFSATLRLLDPTVVVLQGRAVEQWTSILLGDKVKPVSDHADLVRLGERDVYVCRFSHPSARGEGRWGDRPDAPYLREIVEPTLRLVREGLLG